MDSVNSRVMYGQKTMYCESVHKLFYIYSSLCSGMFSEHWGTKWRERFYIGLSIVI